jgi:toxin ParE1/3/4
MVEIVISENALLDLEITLEFISRDSEKNAKYFLRDILLLINKLKIFPHLGRIVKELEDSTIRELIFGNYRVIYKIQTTEMVVVIAIYNSFRDFNANELIL